MAQIEIYYWEDDDQAEDLIQELRKQGKDFRAIQLDPEAGGGQPCVLTPGKTYWSLDEALQAFKAEH